MPASTSASADTLPFASLAHSCCRLGFHGTRGCKARGADWSERRSAHTRVRVKRPFMRPGTTERERVHNNNSGSFYSAGNLTDKCEHTALYTINIMYCIEKRKNNQCFPIAQGELIGSSALHLSLIHISEPTRPP